MYCISVIKYTNFLSMYSQSTHLESPTAHHSLAVANLIKNQSRGPLPAQFITTTFRPELVDVADKTYGIQFQNKISSVECLEKKRAMAFIRKIVAEEGGGEAKEQEEENTPTRRASKRAKTSSSKISSSKKASAKRKREEEA